MAQCLTCGCDIHPKREEILLKTNKRITCLEHSQEEKVCGFQVSAGKQERFLDIVDPIQYTRLKKFDRKSHNAVGGPGLPVFGREQGRVVYKPIKPIKSIKPIKLDK